MEALLDAAEILECLDCALMVADWNVDSQKTDWRSAAARRSTAKEARVDECGLD